MRNAEDEARGEARSRRIGEFIDALQGGKVSGLPRGCTLLTVRVRLPQEEDPSTLLVLRAAGDDGGWISFIGAYGVGDALLAWRKRAQQGTMKWREDVPWEER